MITAPRHNKNKALRVLLTLPVLPPFPTNNNGVLVVSAGGCRVRNLKSPGLIRLPVLLVIIKVYTKSRFPRIIFQKTSLEIADACTGKSVAKEKFGSSDANDDFSTELTELCLDETKRYKFTILDSGGGDGIGNGCDEDYIFEYDGQAGLGLENALTGSGFETSLEKEEAAATRR